MPGPTTRNSEVSEMNVALEPTSAAAPEPAAGEIGLRPIGGHSEWIDPEGDDWLSSIYRELTQEPAPAARDDHAPDPSYWFG